MNYILFPCPPLQAAFLSVCIEMEERSPGRESVGGAEERAGLQALEAMVTGLAAAPVNLTPSWR